MTGWRVVCMSCRRIIRVIDARPILVRRANRRHAISLFGCPDCH